MSAPGHSTLTRTEPQTSHPAGVPVPTTAGGRTLPTGAARRLRPARGRYGAKDTDSGSDLALPARNRAYNQPLETGPTERLIAESKMLTFLALRKTITLHRL